MRAVKKEDMQAFFKNHKPPVKQKHPEQHKQNTSDDETDESAEEKIPNQPRQLSGDVWAMQNPIQTCVGPIGEFILTPESFPKHPSVCLFGKRRTGKSFSLRWIMFNCFRHVPFGNSKLCNRTFCFFQSLQVLF